MISMLLLLWGRGWHNRSPEKRGEGKGKEGEDLRPREIAKKVAKSLSQ
jgi:hypothetical protein